jgi:transketolase
MPNISELQELSLSLRQDIIRMTCAAGSGHPGGSLSVVDILLVLFFREMRINPEMPGAPDRDRFVLSKGHAAPALYAVLAARGFFRSQLLTTLRRLGSPLQGHPDMRKLPGVEISTGSLGQGLSVANGMALAARLSGSRGRVYTVLGDGEIQEGQVWEAAMTAAHYGLDNLVAFVDKNGLQIDGPTCQVKNVDPLGEKWQAFGWHVLEVDGHDLEAIAGALDTAREVRGKPVMIVAHTVKGKGVCFMEGQVDWHGSAPSPEQRDEALQELTTAKEGRP